MMMTMMLLLPNVVDDEIDLPFTFRHSFGGGIHAKSRPSEYLYITLNSGGKSWQKCIFCSFAKTGEVKVRVFER